MSAVERISWLFGVFDRFFLGFSVNWGYFHGFIFIITERSWLVFDRNGIVTIVLRRRPDNLHSFVAKLDLMLHKRILSRSFVTTLDAFVECNRHGVRFQCIRACRVLAGFFLYVALHLLRDIRLKAATVANQNQTNRFLANFLRKSINPLHKH